jgi:hypothetical protein
LPEGKLLTHTNVRYSDRDIGSASAHSSRLENIVVNNVDLNAVNRGELIKTTMDLSHIPLGADLERLKTVNDFRAVQLIDESLKPLWELSKVPSAGFVKDAKFMVSGESNWRVQNSTTCILVYKLVLLTNDWK